MKGPVVAFLAGLLFAVGLALGGMTDPAKVIGFLDIAGDWDPSLAFVMLGAIAIYAPMFRLATRRPAPYLRPSFALPRRGDIDAPLVLGAVLFGIGWGISGYCPGPAVVGAMSLQPSALLFVGMMSLGMWLAYRIRPHRDA